MLPSTSRSIPTRRTGRRSAVVRLVHMGGDSARPRSLCRRRRLLQPPLNVRQPVGCVTANAGKTAPLSRPAFDPRPGPLGRSGKARGWWLGGVRHLRWHGVRLKSGLAHLTLKRPRRLVKRGRPAGAYTPSFPGAVDAPVVRDNRSLVELLLPVPPRSDSFTPSGAGSGSAACICSCGWNCSACSARLS